jgi:hypothetical protein
MFHVDLLKPFYGVPHVQTPDLPPIEHGRVVVQPEKVLDNRIAKGKWELLVRWVGAPAVETAWLTLKEFSEQFPAF